MEKVSEILPWLLYGFRPSSVASISLRSGLCEENVISSISCQSVLNLSLYQHDCMSKIMLQHDVGPSLMLL